MTVLGAVLGIVTIAIVGRWLLMGGDDQPSQSTRLTDPGASPQG
jgi:hypothetical protein